MLLSFNTPDFATIGNLDTYNAIWRAQHIKGKDERIEIRRADSGFDVIIVVYKYYAIANPNHAVNPHVSISTKGKAYFSMEDLSEMYQVIDEAADVLGITRPSLLAQSKTGEEQ